MAPVLKELGKRSGIISRVCMTAQHREMVDPLLDFFGIKRDHDLNVMKPDQSLYDLTGAVIQGLAPVIAEERPDFVLVQGDTTTTLASALAAYYARVPLGHVEAGLRTGDKYNPFPEEVNRRLTDAVSDLLFPPTEQGRQNLLAEGVPDHRILVTGNTVIDALYMTLDRLEGSGSHRQIEKALSRKLGFDPGEKRIVLVTGHRRESFGAEFEGICLGLKLIAQSNPDAAVVYPVHLNPNVRRPVYHHLSDVKGVHLIEPLDYPSFVWLMNKAYLVITDSGGIQEEAPALGKPVLVLRWKTERPEAIEAGVARLVGTNPDAIASEAGRLLKDQAQYALMARKVNPYGDGCAAIRIVDAVSRELGRFGFGKHVTSYKSGGVV